jgi:hypothetical protein
LYKEGNKVILAIVTFQITAPMNVEEAATIFQTTASKYRSVDGLLRKNYIEKLHASGFRISTDVIRTGLHWVNE